MKTTTTNFDLKKNNNIAFPIIIIKVTFPGADVVYYSDIRLIAPVATEPRLINANSVAQQLIEKDGGITNFSFILNDNEQLIYDKCQASNIKGSEVAIYQYFNKLDTSDMLILAKGYVASWQYNLAETTISFSVDSITNYHDKKIGTKATIDLFPDIRKEHDGRVLPLCYGKTEKGETVQVIASRETTLSLDLPVNKSEGVLTDGRDFEQDSILDIFINRELVKARIHGRKITLLARGLTVATGLTSHNATTINSFRASLTPAGFNWVGYYVRFRLPSGLMSQPKQITNYSNDPITNVYAFTPYILWSGSSFVNTIPANTYFEIYSPVVNHSAGEKVYTKMDEYVWIINDGPLDSVDKVEIKGSVVLAGASNKLKDTNIWLDLLADYYTINLDDSQFSTELGYNVATLTMLFDPSQLNNTPYTGDLKPTVVKNINNPVDIIEDLASKIGITTVDATSKAAVQTETSYIELGFTLSETRQGIELLYDLAFQSRIALIFDGDILKFKYLQNKIDTTTTAVVKDNIIDDTLQVATLEEIKNRLNISWLEEGVEKDLVVKDDDSITAYGEKPEDLIFWAHNKRYLAESIALFWLRRWSQPKRLASFSTYLDTIELENGDFVSLTFDNIINESGEVINVVNNPGTGFPGDIDKIDYTVQLFSYGGCSSSCQMFEETGCSSQCEQACTSTDMTGCSYACEFSEQDACSLICVSSCELECTSFAQVAPSCNISSCTNSCQENCQQFCTSNGCQTDSCTSECTASCQFSCRTGCEIICTVGCQTGCEQEEQAGCGTSCQASCTLVGCQTSCTAGCETALQTGCSSQAETGCIGTCQTSCTAQCTTTEETSCFSQCETTCTTGCTLYCQSTCETACQTGGVEATSCSLCCENQCTNSCEDLCQGGSCTAGCTNSCQQGGCQYSCTATCEISCRGNCEQSCQDCCQYDGTETGGWSCDSSCRITGCLQSCQSSCMEICEQNEMGVTVCSTSCQAFCMTAATTGCADYCTVGCECFCQITCESQCRTTACMTSCQCQCQTNMESAACTAGTEVCFSSCQGECQTQDTTSPTDCSLFCQGFCMTDSQVECTLYCTAGCECACQSTCESNCRTTACETACQCACQGSRERECGPYCITSSQFCYSNCQVTCTTNCRAVCEIKATTGCGAECQAFCMTDCMSGCEYICTFGCECDCQSTCESNCRTTACETRCQCLCQTASQ